MNTIAYCSRRRASSAWRPSDTNLTERQKDEHGLKHSALRPKREGVDRLEDVVRRAGDQNGGGDIEARVSVPLHHAQNERIDVGDADGCRESIQSRETEMSARERRRQRDRNEQDRKQERSAKL